MMIFGGFQKLTLLDFPGVVACTLFTRGCNFLCPFCHNAPLVNRPQEAHTVYEEEILAYLRKRRGILEGVCITGGEPLMHTELRAFIETVRALGYRIKLDTNGSFPQRLKEWTEAGLLDYVAMDIKNSALKYPQTTGQEHIDLRAIEESIDLLLGGTIPYEFRTTVTGELHTVEDIAAIARRIRGARVYYLQNFADSGHIIGQGLTPVAPGTLALMRQAAEPFVGRCETR